MNTLRIALATLITASTFSGAQAATWTEAPRRQEVGFVDLDLTQDRDAEQLYRRIRDAARDVCRTRGVSAVLFASGMRNCAANATARAVADVNAPLLTQRHAARIGADGADGYQAAIGGRTNLRADAHRDE